MFTTTDKAPIYLTDPIPEGKKFITVTEVTTVFDYYNIKKDVTIMVDGDAKTLTAGYYGADDFQKLFKEIKIDLDTDKSTGQRTMSCRKDVTFGQELLDLLHISNLTAGVEGSFSDKIQLAPLGLFLHCEEVNTSENYFNGSPSNLLLTLPITGQRYGDAIYWKGMVTTRLNDSELSKIEFTLRDQDGNKLPFRFVMKYSIR